MVGARVARLPVANGGLVNADRSSERFLGEPLALTKLEDSGVNWPVELATGLRSLAPLDRPSHASRVDQRYTHVNTKSPTDSPRIMGVSQHMGDARHKRPPPDDPEEDVTADFRREVIEALDINARRNRLRRLKKGDAGYLVSNRAELAVAIGTDKTMVNKIIGPKKPSNKVKLVDRSAFVARIRDALELAVPTSIAVKGDRAAALKWFNELSDEKFKIYDDEYKRETRK